MQFMYLISPVRFMAMVDGAALVELDPESDVPM